MKQFKINLISLLIILILTGAAGFTIPYAAAAERCEEWVARIVSVQGSVQARKIDEAQWKHVGFSNTFCIGDMLRIRERSRAAIVLSNETIIRLDQNTTITFTGVEKKKTSLMEVLTGVVHLFSRTPRTLKIITPFVNGTVEGTEFLVEVTEDQSIITVFEGWVNAANKEGSLTLKSGQSAIAGAGRAPAFHVVIRPGDAVQWALYYPPIMHYRADDFPGGAESDWQAMVKRSIQFYRKGDLTTAFSSIREAPEDIRDSRFFNYRAVLLLSAGRVDEARADIDRSLNLSPGDSLAVALQSVIAVVLNEKEKALGLALKAVEADPESAAARIALSYASQADFELEEALESLREAVRLDPENSLAWARLAELWLSFGNVNKALEAAEKAVELSPDLARTQTVLGFAYLTRVKTPESIKAFEKAIELDQADPLPRLGLGLAKIRKGRLKEGRREIEIAASLDPNNSLIRSYLGKSFYEEKRDKLAKNQFEIAGDLDPLDPTSFFYSAIRKQSVNRPAEALHDLQKSIELNDNRAVYRSKLLLDDDLAARSAGLARIYSDLGFQQLALVEGWKSVNIDPGNYSAHRFLADSYSALPRHEIARVSELLQSQLLQPLNITPVQPQLAEGNLLILNGAGPGELSFNEFNPVFNRDRVSLQASGIVGENRTRGDELVISGVKGKASISVGQFHYESDGYRENNDLDEDIYNVFTQIRLSHKTSIQAEFRYTEIEKGDLPLRFDPDDFLDNIRQKERTNSIRLGFHHAFTPHSDLIGSVIYGNSDIDTMVKEDLTLPFPPFSTHMDAEFLTDEDDRYLAEIQHLFRMERFHVITGIGHLDIEQENANNITFQPEVPPIFLNSSFTTRNPIRHSNFYVYSLINYPKTITLTIGGSADHLQDRDLELDLDRFNPKLGFTWNPFSDTTLRAAIFRVVKRTLITKQTLEPTQVAGFNQFFDDDVGAISWRYGIGIDQKLSSAFYSGLELSEREIEVPRIMITTNQPNDFDWREQLGRIYLYWAPWNWLALSSEYQFERFDRDPEYTGIDDFMEIKTNRIPLEINFFHRLGLSARLKTTYVDQKGEFGNILDGFMQERDRFWVVDASIGYRLPRRWGIITVDVRNLFDEEFRFQDTDPANPSIYPERLILGKFTLSI